MDKGVFVDDLLTLALIAVDGPGIFSVYKTNMGQPTVFMTGGNGMDANGASVMPAGEHGHFNIPFSEAGWFQITVESSAVDQATLERMTSTETFTFHVVPEPATLILLGIGGALIRRKQ